MQGKPQGTCTNPFCDKAWHPSRMLVLQDQAVDADLVDIKCLLMHTAKLIEQPNQTRSKMLVAILEGE